MINCMTDINGKALKHIVGLRDCNKTQWETRDMARTMKGLVSSLKGAEGYASVLGASCLTQGICNEGKECCGKVYTLKNCKMPKKEEPKDLFKMVDKSIEIYKDYYY